LLQPTNPANVGFTTAPHFRVLARTGAVVRAGSHILAWRFLLAARASRSLKFCEMQMHSSAPESGTHKKEGPSPNTSAVPNCGQWGDKGGTDCPLYLLSLLGGNSVCTVADVFSILFSMFQCTRDHMRWICGRNSKEEMLLPWKCRWLAFVDLLGYRLGHPSAEAVAGVAVITIAAAPC
jgi:hypothetical protein